MEENSYAATALQQPFMGKNKLIGKLPGDALRSEGFCQREVEQSGSLLEATVLIKTIM